MRKAIVIGISLLGLSLLCFTSIVVGYLFFPSQEPVQIVSHDFPLQQKWCFTANEDIRSTPVEYKKQVLVRTNKRLYAVNAITGELIWSVSLPFPPIFQPFLSPPLIQDDIVVITRENDAFAFNAETGAQLWHVNVKHSSIRRTYPAFVTNEMVIIVGNNIEGRNLQNGKILWEIDRIESRYDPVVIVEGEYLYVFSRLQVRIFEVETGERVRMMPLGRWSSRGWFFEDGIFYFENDFGGVSAFDLATRKLLWRHRDLPPIDYPMTKDSDKLIIGLVNSHPIAINVETGETIWQAQNTPSDTYLTPLVLGNTVYVRNLSQKAIHALDLQSGDRIGYLELGNPSLITTIPDHSLGPIEVGSSIVFAVDDMLCAYGN